MKGQEDVDMRRLKVYHWTILIVPAIIMAGILSCGDSEFEYDSSPCYLVFDNSVHQDPLLPLELPLFRIKEHVVADAGATCLL